MVRMTLWLTATRGGASRLVDALHCLVRQSRRHRGCAEAHVAADIDEAEAYWYWEDWDDEQALEEELRSDQFTQLLALMETSRTPPVLDFRTITETRGLEYVSAVRAQQPR